MESPLHRLPWEHLETSEEHSSREKNRGSECQTKHLQKGWISIPTMACHGLVWHSAIFASTSPGGWRDNFEMLRERMPRNLHQPIGSLCFLSRFISTPTLPRKSSTHQMVSYVHQTIAYSYFLKLEKKREKCKKHGKPKKQISKIQKTQKQNKREKKGNKKERQK